MTKPRNPRRRSVDPFEPAAELAAVLHVVQGLNTTSMNTSIAQARATTDEVLEKYQSVSDLQIVEDLALVVLNQAALAERQAKDLWLSAVQATKQAQTLLIGLTKVK